jgi:hypothetical protein
VEKQNTGSMVDHVGTGAFARPAATTYVAAAPLSLYFINASFA